MCRYSRGLIRNPCIESSILNILEAKNDFFASGNDFNYERERRFDPSTVTPKFDYKDSRSKRDHYRKKYVDAYVG